MAKWTEEQKQAAREAYKARTSEAPKEIQVPQPEEAIKPMGMDYECKIQSMTNAIKILPPNMIKDGRHLKENIQAICGFMVSDEMMDEVYKEYVHPDYN